MDIFYRRPLMLVCACFLAVSALAFSINTSFKLALITVLIALTVAALAVAVILREKQGLRIKLSVLIIALILSLTAAAESYFYFDIYAASTEKHIGKNCRIVATVVEERRANAYDSEYLIAVEQINGDLHPVKALLCFDIAAGLHEGSVIALNAECTTLEELSYDHSHRLNCLAEGITAGFFVDDADNVKIDELVSDGGKWSFSDLNFTLSRKLEKGIGGESGKLASAMLLGNRHLLSPETTRDFARTGLSHILSLSGMHMALLTGFFELILRYLRVPKLARSCLMPFVMLGYLMLTGFELPALRSAIMLTVVYVSFIAASPSDVITVLFATCASIVAFIPSSAADVGFWMSFLATMGIIILSPYAAKLFRIKKRDGNLKNIVKRALRYLVSAVAVTLTAVFSVVFITWLCFGELSLLSPVANLYASPLTALMMVTSALYLILGGIPFLGGALAASAEVIGNVMLDLTAELSKVRGATVSLRYDFVPVIVLAFCASMSVLLIIRLRRKILVLIPPVIAVVSFAVCLIISNNAGADTSALTYLRRGEREMLLLSRNGQAVLCDLSDGTYTNHAAAWQIAADKECATELEALILTHYHDKHRGSVERLLSAVRVRSVWMPTPTDENEFRIARELFRIAAEHDAACTLYDPETELCVFGDRSVKVSTPEYLDRSVQPTLTVEFFGRKGKTLYIGSSYLETSDAPSDADTVIFGTHGPNPKLGYSIDFAANADRLVFADEELLSLAWGGFDGAVIKNCEYIRIES